VQHFVLAGRLSTESDHRANEQESVTVRTTLISRRETSEPASRRDYTAELVKCGRDVGLLPQLGWID
jgi:hypothetical protein